MGNGELGPTEDRDGFTVGRHIGLQFYCGATTLVLEFFGWISDLDLCVSVSGP